jgi:hypothetical protein
MAEKWKEERRNVEVRSTTEENNVSSSTGPRGSYETSKESYGYHLVGVWTHGVQGNEWYFGACIRGLRGPNEDPTRLKR